MKLVQNLLMKLAVVLAGFCWCHAGEIRIERLFGPEVPTGDYKHPASITELANGDL